jgi:hypothetical protein
VNGRPFAPIVSSDFIGVMDAFLARASGARAEKVGWAKARY